MIDNQKLREYFVPTWGFFVKRLKWMSVLFLLGAAVYVSAVPRVDAPETSFNEADAPVNLAPPVRASLRVVRTAVDPVVVWPTLPFYSATCVFNGRVLGPIRPSQHRRHSLQNLLCIFLI